MHRRAKCSGVLADEPLRAMAETTEIRLPRLADSVTSVKFGAWLKQEGDRVEAGEPIAEVETDKTTVELEAPVAGVLCDVRVAPGADGLEVGVVLARIAPAAGEPAGAESVPPPDAAPGPEDGARPGPGDEAAVRGSGPPVGAAPDPEPSDGAALIETVARDEAPAVGDGEPAVPGDSSAAPGAPAARDEARAAPDEAPASTPLALRMVAAAGLDLSAIQAAGPDGRIRKADVDRVLAARRGASGEWHAPSARGAPAGEGAASGEGPPAGEGAEPSLPTTPVGLAPPPPPPEAPAEAGAPGDAGAPHHEQPLTAMRRVTATRMQQAKQTVPHFYLRTECRVDAALGFLAAAKRHSPDAPPTLTDLVVRAAACALRIVPQANSAWVDGAVRVYDRVDVAVAVSTPHGLVAPVVRGAERKDLGAIARETRDLAARARAGRLAPAEYAGGTFTISNLGMYGVESLYAIVNPPQSCILGVGAASRRPVAAGDGVGVGTVMACTLSADHRVIDGAAGAELLEAIRSCLEQPALMLLRTEASPPRDRGGSP